MADDFRLLGKPPHTEKNIPYYAGILSNKFRLAFGSGQKPAAITQSYKEAFEDLWLACQKDPDRFKQAVIENIADSKRQEDKQAMDKLFSGVTDIYYKKCVTKDAPGVDVFYSPATPAGNEPPKKKRVLKRKPGESTTQLDPQTIGGLVESALASAQLKSPALHEPGNPTGLPKTFNKPTIEI